MSNETEIDVEMMIPSYWIESSGGGVVLIERQPDGYYVEREGDIIHIHGTRHQSITSLNFTHFKPFSELSPATQNIIRKKISDTSGLWADVGGKIGRIRDIGSVCRDLMVEIEAYRTEQKRRAELDKVEQEQRLAKAQAQAGEEYIPCRVWPYLPPKYLVGDIEIKWARGIHKNVDGYNFVLKAAYEKAAAELAEKQAMLAEKKKKEQEKIDAALRMARETGKPVLLTIWQTDRCMNNHGDDCSCDNAYEYVMPDGSRKVEYHCCF